MLRYKQLLDPLVYEDTRENLSRNGERVTDQQVEEHYAQWRLIMEKEKGDLSDAQFKQVAEFSLQFKVYDNALTSEQRQRLPPCHDSITRRLVVVEAMQKEGYFIPPLVLEETRKYQAREKAVQDFLKDLIEEGMDIKQAYHEYSDWFHQNFPDYCSMNKVEFRDIFDRLK